MGEDAAISSTIFTWTAQGLSVSQHRRDGYTDALFAPGVVTMTLYTQSAIITVVLTSKGVALNLWPQDGLEFQQYPWSVDLKPRWESSYGVVRYMHSHSFPFMYLYVYTIRCMLL